MPVWYTGSLLNNTFGSGKGSCYPNCVVNIRLKEDSFTYTLQRCARSLTVLKPLGSEIPVSVISVIKVYSYFDHFWTIIFKTGHCGKKE